MACIGSRNASRRIRSRTISNMSGLLSPHQARSQTQRRPGRFSGEAVIGQAHALKTRALVKLGELLKSLEKNQGARPGKTGTKGLPVLDNTPTYADLGVTKKLAAVAQQLAALPEATREAIAQREVTPYARSLVRGLPRISSSLLINVRGPAVEYLDHPTHRLAGCRLPSAQQRR